MPQFHTVEKRLDLNEVVEALLGSAQVLWPGRDEEVPLSAGNRA
ncbi:hypothetical protein [Streptomyces sp. NBC_01727]|nr:hypothetical protein OIE76_36805 [Streptomyces sp. NBC_01727]